MKIRNIQIHPQGPLKNQINLNAKSLNLIYGKNETGKTYVLEAISSWLFGKGRSSPFKGIFRDWTPSATGSVEVSAIDPQNLEHYQTFEPNSKISLQDQLGNQFELSPDLARLFVVKAGESFLDSPESLVKNTLSASGTLEELLSNKRISKGIQSANFGINHQQIEGRNAGELKDRNKLAEEINTLKQLREKYFSEQGNSLNASNQELKDLLEEQKNLEEAKIAYGVYLFAEKEKVQQQLSEASQYNISEIKIKLASLRDNRARIREFELDLIELQKNLQEKPWLESVLGKFKELSASKEAKRRERGARKPLLLFLSTLGVLGALASFFWSPLVSVTIGILGVGFLLAWVFIRSDKGKDTLSDTAQELNQLLVNFKEKFGNNEATEHDMQAKLNELIRLQGEKDKLSETLNKIRTETVESHTWLEAQFSKLFKDVKSDEWETKIDEYEANLKKLDKRAYELQAKTQELGFISCPKSGENGDGMPLSGKDVSNDNLASNWDPLYAKEVEQKIFDLQEFENNANLQNNKLKAEILSVTDADAENWEDLLGALEGKINLLQNQYKEKTASIIGKMSVVSAVRKLQEYEDEMIMQNLSSEEISEGLRRISGDKFVGYLWEDGGLKVVNPLGQSFPLYMLSTGASEQVMLALRILFASHFLGERSGFLLLDDAFQHSDWERRAKLVDYSIELVKDSGWQIFYFTMDDHLAHLFHDRAKTVIPQDFTYLNLSAN